MHRWGRMAGTLALLAWAGASHAQGSAALREVDVARLEDSRTADAELDRLYSGTAERPSRSLGGTAAGAWTGVEQGALLGFYSGLSPALALLDRAFEHNDSCAFDGAMLLGLVLYGPSLVLGAVGGLFGAPSGAAAELAEPGSTRRWDAERFLFDGRRK